MSEIAVTKDDQGRTIETRQNDVIVFRLEENLSTGFGWEAEAMDSSVVELIESAYIEAPGTTMGRAGTRVLNFAARSPGSQTIRLRLRRPWDPPDRVQEQLEVTIRVA